MKNNILIIFLFSISSVYTLQGQGLQLTSLSVEDGLPSNNVYGAMQDSKGFIWFFTDKGVSKFNGSEFTTFTVQDGLQTNDVWDMSEDKQGRKWLFAYGDKMQYILNGQVHDIILERSIRKKYYYTSSFHEDITEFYSLNAIQRKNKHPIEHEYQNFYVVGDTLKYKNSRPALDAPNKISDFPVNIYFNKDTLAFNKQKENAILTNAILNKKFLPAQRSNGNLTSLRMQLVQLKDSTRLREYIILINTESKQVFEPDFKHIFDGLPTYAFATNMDDYIEIQTNLGTLVYDENFKLIDKFIFAEHGLDYNVNKAFIDNNSNTWICTQDRGVIFVKASNKKVSRLSCFDDKNIVQLFGDPNNIYACDREGNIFNYNDNSCDRLLNINAEIIYSNDFKPSENNVYNIVPYKDKYFVCSKYDLQILDPAERTVNSALEELLDITDISFRATRDVFFREEENQLIVARNAGLLSRKKDNPIEGGALLNKEATNVITPKTANTLYIGTYNGIYLQQIEPPTSEKLFAEQLNTRVTEIELYNSLILIGTDGYGLVYAQGDSLRFEKTLDRAIISEIKVIDGNIWVASNIGIHVYEIDEGNTLSLKTKLNKSTGLISNEIQSIFHADDYIYAGTKSGLNRISKDAIIEEINNPLLYHTTTAINGEDFALEKNNTLKNTQNNLHFSFEGVSLKELNSLKYEYTLNGTTSNTIQSAENSINYFNLAPGDYSFSAQAIDISDQRSIDPYQIKFSISQPWYKRTGTIILGILLLPFLSFLFYKNRVKEIEFEAKKQTEISKKFAELEMQALRSQMNPHFVFNCINTIQYLIDSDQSEEASKYLNKFASLMRLYLESSKESSISLNEEVELLKNYLSLEQMRLDGNFEYQIRIDDQTRNSIINIPSMMIQPFVENAIVHGLFHKKGNKILTIQFESTNDNQIRCIIEDNGIGRKKAEELKVKAKGKHKSRGIQIIQERLQLLDRNDKPEFNIQFEDLFNEKQEAIGTRVVLLLDTL